MSPQTLDLIARIQEALKEIPASAPAGQVERKGSINSGAGICGLNTIADGASSHAGDEVVKLPVARPALPEYWP